MDCTLFFSTILPNWLVAIGTIGAVITSLWFSYQSNKIKAKGSAKYMQEWTIPPGLVRRELILLKILNTGKVPFVIESFHIEFKPKTDQAYMLIPDPSYGYISAPLPARLEFSDEFTLQMERTAFENLLSKSSGATSVRFYAVTKLDDRIDLKMDLQLEEFINNWKRKRRETIEKGEESV
ncbi:MAG: hypothetical protein SH817_11840 [Leptospira sp.]|nr:hypothetical protein [Leptospira sp.]